MAWLARCALVALSLLTIALGSPVYAQSYPSKNVNLIVSIGPGTGMDVLARLYAEKLAAVLGKPVVVENKPGAATMIAAAQIATSPPDGHTLGVLTSSALAINQHLYKQMNYSPDNDFTPISLYVKSPLILVVNPNSPAKTVPEFIALAKKSNPPLTYASLGAGVFQHICDGTRQAALRLRRNARSLQGHRPVRDRPGGAAMSRPASSRPARRSR